MNAIALSQFALGLSIGLAAWFVTYLFNRAWLGFWSVLR